jgi:hypothetical protein
MTMYIHWIWGGFTSMVSDSRVQEMIQEQKEAALNKLRADISHTPEVADLYRTLDKLLASESALKRSRLRTKVRKSLDLAAKLGIEEGVRVLKLALLTYMKESMGAEEFPKMINSVAASRRVSASQPEWPGGAG